MPARTKDAHREAARRWNAAYDAWLLAVFGDTRRTEGRARLYAAVRLANEKEGR